MTGTGLLELQREISRKLGRSVLLLQQYELMAKQLIVQHVVGGVSVDDMEADRANRAEAVGKMTLGQLAKDLAGNVFESGARSENSEREKEPPLECIKESWFRTSFAVSFPVETFDDFKRQLDELVLMRNSLVHHFLQRFNVFEQVGCETAVSYLDSCMAIIERHVVELQGWLKHMKEARQHYIDVLIRPDIQAFMDREFAPDPPEDIYRDHPLVQRLLQAEGEVGEEGWTLLTSAIKYLRKIAPDETPKRYKVRNWQQVLRRSRVFEVKKELPIGGQKLTVWYRRVE